MLSDEGIRADSLARSGEALNKPADDQEDRGQDADLRVGGQEADADGRRAHHQDDEREDLPATNSVTERAEDEPAKRPHDEADGIDGKG